MELFVLRIIFWSDNNLHTMMPYHPEESEHRLSNIHLRLAPVLVVVARWSTDLDVFFTSDDLCTTLTVDK